MGRIGSYGVSQLTVLWISKAHRFKDNDAIIVAVATLSDDQLSPNQFHVPVVSFAERDAAKLHHHRSLSAITIFNHGILNETGSVSTLDLQVFSMTRPGIQHVNMPRKSTITTPPDMLCLVLFRGLRLSRRNAISEV